MEDRSVGYLITNTKLDNLETKLLLRDVLDFTQAELIINNEYILNESQYNEFLQLLAKRQKGMPISYLLGYKEFYSRNFKVSQDTLIPRPETELLVETALRLSKANDHILDLGTGCGCIAITCKLQDHGLTVVAVDNSLEAWSRAKYNATKLKANVKFVHSDWYTNINDKFNIIISNPPYIASNDEHLKNLNYEPKIALTDFANGLEHIKKIIAGGVEHLYNGGFLILEHGFNQALEVKEIFENYGYSEITTLKDYAALDRITYAVYKL
jgi:release factor glutamine methyltransferase